MNINRRKRRCHKCAFFLLSPLSRHYKFSPSCNPISLSPPLLPPHDDVGEMLPAGLPDDLSRTSEDFPNLDAADTEANIISNADPTGTGSSDKQQGLNSASSPHSPSHISAADDLVEEDKYERFISDCNSPHTTTLFPAHSMPPLGTYHNQQQPLFKSTTCQQLGLSPQLDQLVSHLVQHSFSPWTLTKGGTTSPTMIMQ